MEPERNIEKVLRDLAKRRRDEAGEPHELHPATRRLFQAEIARRYAKRQQTSERSFFARFGRVFAYAACFVALILCGILVLPSLTPSKSKEVASASRAQADKEVAPMRQPAPATSAAVSSDEVASTARRTPSESAPKNQEVRSEDQFKAKSNEESKLADIASVNRRRDISSNEVQNAVSLEPAAAAPPIVETQIALAEKAVAPTTPPSGTADIAGGGGGAAAPQQTFFRRSVQESDGKQREATGTSEQTPVLLSFIVQQEGTHLRFVDSDGSVYSGLLVVTNVLIEGNAASNGLVDFPFTVSGSNRTLQEWVVFDGNFLANDGPARSEAGKDSLGVLKSEIPSLSSPNWRVTGTATVGITNQIKVEAAPAAAPPAKP